MSAVGPDWMRRAVQPVPVVDPTGAGDASLAALIDTLLAFDVTPATMTAEFADFALERSTRVASHVVQRAGAMGSLADFRL